MLAGFVLATVMSMSVFFTMVIGGLSGTLPDSLRSGLAAAGAPPALAEQLSHLLPAKVERPALIRFETTGRQFQPRAATTLEKTF